MRVISFVPGIFLLGVLGCGSSGFTGGGTPVAVTGCQVAVAACPPSLPGSFCPKCDPADQSLWLAMQCSGSTGFCWCVDTSTGVQQGQQTRASTTLPCYTAQ